MYRDSFDLRNGHTILLIIRLKYSDSIVFHLDIIVEWFGF